MLAISSSPMRSKSSGTEICPFIKPGRAIRNDGRHGAAVFRDDKRAARSRPLDERRKLPLHGGYADTLHNSPSLHTILDSIPTSAYNILYRMLNNFKEGDA
jgi:hypothetical protein